jgi:2-phosphosulfolactate phosphatase
LHIFAIKINCMKKNTVEVCYSPHLFELFDAINAIVVVIDVLRATSSICSGFNNGVNHIIPLASVEDSLALRKDGYLVAAERNGEMIAGFDLGNSPFGYMDEKVKGAKIALTTTNGTQAIEAAKNAYKVVIGSFLNLDVLCEWLKDQNRNVICLCAGWKNKFNLEDTLLAGAIVNSLKNDNNFDVDCDSALGAEHLYLLAKNDLNQFLENSSHRKRLAKLNIEKDIEYCLTPNQCAVIPVLQGNKLVNIYAK